MKRTLVADQTRPWSRPKWPGFNQFYDDLSANRSWVYGAAVDQKFGKKLFGGVEFSRRDLRIPVLLNFSPDIFGEADGKERLARTYLFAIAHQWVALSAEYDMRSSNRTHIAESRPITCRSPSGSFIPPASVPR